MTDVATDPQERYESLVERHRAMVVAAQQELDRQNVARESAMIWVVAPFAEAFAQLHNVESYDAEPLELLDLEVSLRSPMSLESAFRAPGMVAPALAVAADEELAGKLAGLVGLKFVPVVLAVHLLARARNSAARAAHRERALREYIAQLDAAESQLDTLAARLDTFAARSVAVRAVVGRLCNAVSQRVVWLEQRVAADGDYAHFTREERDRLATTAVLVGALASALWLELDGDGSIDTTVDAADTLLERLDG